MLFGKGSLAKFNTAAARDGDFLSSYWLKYPERYHPLGKAPSDLWHFPIPIQGSWSQASIRHFCPFPIGLVARMIQLTSDPGDIVLDPFAGTGSVLVAADFLKRYGVGIEVNSKTCRQFGGLGFESLSSIAKSELSRKELDRIAEFIRSYEADADLPDFLATRRSRFFGSTDSKNNAIYRKWGIKKRTNEDMRADYIRRARELVEGRFGLKLPAVH